jgi:cytosine/adenosine deaminase-related metal-dependent hydrolase
MATRGGARCLGRVQEIGALGVGMLADVALWRVDGLAGAGIADPVCTLVFGAPSLERLYVSGTPIVAAGELLTADTEALAAQAAQAAALLAGQLS